MLCALALWIVGVYRPVGVESATLMSAAGRMVSEGLGESGEVIMELRKMGHSIMALERVFRRMGRYVSRVYCWDSGISYVGAGYTDEGLTAWKGAGLDDSGR